MADQPRLHAAPATARKFLVCLVIAFQYTYVNQVISIFTHSESRNLVSPCSHVHPSSQCHGPWPWHCIRKMCPIPSMSACNEKPMSPENTVPAQTALGAAVFPLSPLGWRKGRCPPSFSLPQADNCPSFLPQTPKISTKISTSFRFPYPSFFLILFSIPGIHAGHFQSLCLLGLLSTVTIPQPFLALGDLTALRSTGQGLCSVSLHRFARCFSLECVLTGENFLSAWV